MTAVRYLLDENLSPRLARASAQHAADIDISRVGMVGAPPLGTSDPIILAWCVEEGFSLVTRNRASMPVHLEALLAAGDHVPGIFVLDPNLSIGEAAAELFLIWGASEAQEYRDLLVHVPLRR